VKRGMAEMLNGGVIMDVATPEQAEMVGINVEEIPQPRRLAERGR
jgi:pyridoxal biosynthesis lyase PdxS